MYICVSIYFYIIIYNLCICAHTYTCMEGLGSQQLFSEWSVVLGALVWARGTLGQNMCQGSFKGSF